MKRVAWDEPFKMPKRCRGELAPDEGKAADAVRWAFNAIDSEDISLLAIATEWNRRGLRNRKGKPWRHDSVPIVLANKSYCGRSAYGAKTKGQFHQLDAEGEIVAADGEHQRVPLIVAEDCHEGLVSPELFDRVQSRFAARRGRKRTRRPQMQSEYLLTGVIKCGHCGADMCGETTKGGAAANYYRCGNHAGCPKRRRIRQDAIERRVAE